MLRPLWLEDYIMSGGGGLEMHFDSKHHPSKPDKLHYLNYE